MENKAVRGLLRLRLRIGVLAMLALVGVALAGCDTLVRHGRSSDGCYCYADVYHDNPPIIGHGWKI
jgi:hypothetical protein